MGGVEQDLEVGPVGYESGIRGYLAAFEVLSGGLLPCFDVLCEQRFVPMIIRGLIICCYKQNCIIV